MMLGMDQDGQSRGFIGALERYLEETLHDRVKLTSLERVRHLPSFLEKIYKLYEGLIAGRQCVFLISSHNEATPSEIAKHVELVRSDADAIVVFVTQALSAHNRSRLLKHGVPFIVPGNQLYIPELAVDLREHFRTLKLEQTNTLSPAAQAVLFHYMLRLDENARTPSQLAERLHYSAMSIGRAFDDLVAAGLASTEKHGKERHIVFEHRHRLELLNDAHRVLRSPVRAEKFVRNGHITLPLKKAGESALAILTNLSRPQIDTYAVAASDWKAVSAACGFIETNRYDAEFFIETWAYDPASLSDGSTVDPLSLYAQFHEHRDERIAMAAQQLLENIEW